MPAGRDRSSGFYRPLELFYSRRIGKSLSDGSVVPLQFGAKAFGRISDWEYGGFLARTGSHDYVEDAERLAESSALFGSMRLKRQILDNSSIGFLFVGKHDTNGDDGVFDVDRVGDPPCGGGLLELPVAVVPFFLDCIKLTLT